MRGKGPCMQALKSPKELGGGRGMQKDIRKGSVYTGFDGVQEVEEEV